MRNQLLIELSKNSVALFAGICLTLACAPFNIFPLALLSAGLLIFLWLDIPADKAFIRGFFYGIGLFGSGVYWVYISMHSYAGIPWPLAMLLTTLFMACLALFPAVHGWLLNRFFPQTTSSKIICAFPALWVFIEWVRSWLFSGFPWLFIGYSQTHSPLRGFAPLLSVYGVSLMTAISSGLVVNALRHFKQKQAQPGYWNLLLLLLIWVLGSLLGLISWTKPLDKSLQISLIQANIPQQLKWLPEQVEPTLQLYWTLTEQHWDSEVIIWPEGAIPTPLNDIRAFIDKMATVARKHHSTLITGIPIRNQLNNDYFNAVISMGTSGDSLYLKHRLVPFGEYVPLRRWLGSVLGFLNIPMSDLIAARGLQEPLNLPHHIKMLTFICYEIAFPEQVLYTLQDIGLILAVTNDAWFGHSIAQAQHLQIAAMRALEMGRPLLFASNNGITAIISANGTLLAAAPPFETYVLTKKIQPYTGTTPWQKYAMDPVLLILIILLYTAYKYRRATQTFF